MRDERRPSALTVCLGLMLVLCLPSCTRPQADTAPVDRTAEAKAFVDLLAAGDFAGAVTRFDETMKQALPADKLRETWEGLVAAVGPYQGQLRTRTAHEQGYDIVFVTCHFDQADLDIRVVYNGRGEISGMWTTTADRSAEYQPPSYVRPESFEEHEVTVGTGEWALPGTLTLPRGKAPVPAVVLVHGSGPQDRDESLGPSKPFRDLAEGLASRGIAVLRYEKRTRQYQSKLAQDQAGLTVKEETIDDAVAAVALLRQTEGIDPQRVFVLGHSLGGTLAPRIAEAAPEVRGLIILAGATRPLEDLTIEQLDYIASLPGEHSQTELDKIAEMKAEAERVKASDLSDDTEGGKLLLGAPASYWRDLRAYSPTETAARLSLPMLILQGGRDYQVTEVDLENWRRALAGRAHVTLKLYPDLNHLFAEGEGKATPKEYEKLQHVAPQVIEDIARWIDSQKPREQ